ncbi:hypothetical protein D9M71_775310 [compost metagenome]
MPIEAGGGRDQCLLVAFGQFGIHRLLALQRIAPCLRVGACAAVHALGQGIDPNIQTCADSVQQAGTVLALQLAETFKRAA